MKVRTAMLLNATEKQEWVDMYDENKRFPKNEVPCTTCNEGVTMFGDNLKKRITKFGSAQELLDGLVCRDCKGKIKRGEMIAPATPQASVEVEAPTEVEDEVETDVEDEVEVTYDDDTEETNEESTEEESAYVTSEDNSEEVVEETTEEVVEEDGAEYDDDDVEEEEVEEETTSMTTDQLKEKYKAFYATKSK